MSPPDDRTEHRKGNPDSKERLHRISRHFLSDEETIYRIALLNDADDPQPLPVDGLARALAGRGRTVAVVDTAEKLIALIRPDPDQVPRSAPAPSIERFLANIRSNPAPDIMLIAAPPTTRIAACDLALFAVPAQPRCLRSAYLRLKALTELERMPRIGITLTGADNRDQAVAGFNKIAGAAHNFLGITVISYSYLAGGADRREAVSSLDDIAGLLLDDLDGSEQHRKTQREPEQVMTKHTATTGQP